jgi:hypothetical protein
MDCPAAATSSHSTVTQPELATSARGQPVLPHRLTHPTMGLLTVPWAWPSRQQVQQAQRDRESMLGLTGLRGSPGV